MALTRVIPVSTSIGMTRMGRRVGNGTELDIRLLRLLSDKDGDGAMYSSLLDERSELSERFGSDEVADHIHRLLAQGLVEVRHLDDLHEGDDFQFKITDSGKTYLSENSH